MKPISLVKEQQLSECQTSEQVGTIKTKLEAMFEEILRIQQVAKDS